MITINYFLQHCDGYKWCQKWFRTKRQLNNYNSENDGSDRQAASHWEYYDNDINDGSLLMCVCIRVQWETSHAVSLSPMPSVLTHTYMHTMHAHTVRRIARIKKEGYRNIILQKSHSHTRRCFCDVNRSCPVSCAHAHIAESWSSCLYPECSAIRVQPKGNQHVVSWVDRHEICVCVCTEWVHCDYNRRTKMYPKIFLSKCSFVQPNCSWAFWVIVPWSIITSLLPSLAFLCHWRISGQVKASGKNRFW